MPTRITTTLPTTQFSVADGNWDSNRGPIQGIVIHTMDGTVAGANARFNDPSSSVSAHYGVGLDGTLYQWVDEDNVAYQCGNYVVNQTTIGIEHEDGGNYNSVRPDILYQKSAELVADICRFYDFPADSEHIFKHCDVIDKRYFPGGTSCPDALDVDRIIRMAQAILNPPAPIVEPTPPVTVATPPPVTPVETPLPEPVQPQTDQTVSNSVQNTPEQSATQPVEPSQTPSNIPVEVPNTPKSTNSLSLNPFSVLYALLVRLLVQFHVLEEVKP